MDYLFLLRLKAHYSSGFVSDNLREIGEKVGESRGVVYSRLERLNTLGWINTHKKGNKPSYSLISNAKLWSQLGFELKSNGKGYKNCDVIYKIKSNQHIECFTSKKDLEIKLAAFEVIRKLQKMTYKRDNKVESKRAKSNSVPLQLSCESSANLIGYKSAAKGAMIQRELESIGVLNITRSRVAIKSCHILKYKEEISDYRGTSASFSHNKKGYGTIFKSECNKLSIKDKSFVFKRERPSKKASTTVEEYERILLLEEIQYHENLLKAKSSPLLFTKATNGLN